MNVASFFCERSSSTSTKPYEVREYVSTIVLSIVFQDNYKYTDKEIINKN